MLQDLIHEFEYLKDAIDRRAQEGRMPEGMRVPLAMRRAKTQSGDGAYYTGGNRIVIVDHGTESVREATSDGVHEAFRRFEYREISINESLRITNAALRQYVKRD